MTDAAKLVARVRDEAVAQVYLVCTGAGAGLQQLVWSVPGVSSFLVGASFPYATNAIDEFIGFTPERYSSEATAVDMASAAFLRAGGGPNAVGIAVTAKVASIEHRGGAPRWRRRRGPGVVTSIEFEKDAGVAARERDGARADPGLAALLDAGEAERRAGADRRRMYRDGAALRRASLERADALRFRIRTEP
jgi:hypothetical protein